MAAGENDERKKAAAEVDRAAQILLGILQERGFLPQETAAAELQQQFGVSFLEISDRGNPSVPKAVRSRLRELAGDDLTYQSRGGRGLWELSTRKGEARRPSISDRLQRQIGPRIEPAKK